MSKSKKGGNNEREIAKYLTKWISGRDKPYLFWRTPQSGGLATIHEENKHLTGDIYPLKEEIKEWWPFSIEAKTGYPKNSFWQHFIDVKFGIEDFWLQSCNDAKKAGKQPMLIYRKKGRKWIVGINKRTNNKLKKYLKSFNSITVKWSNKIEDCVLYDFDNFFTITPEQIKENLYDFIKKEEMEIK